MKLIIKGKEIEIKRYSAALTEVDIEFSSNLSNIEVLELFKDNPAGFEIKEKVTKTDEVTGELYEEEKTISFKGYSTILNFSSGINLGTSELTYFIIISSK